MFESLPSVCRELHGNLREIYWILLGALDGFSYGAWFFQDARAEPQCRRNFKKGFCIHFVAHLLLKNVLILFLW